jgi:alpha-glucosidase
MVSHAARVLLTESGVFIPLDESNESIYAYIRDDPTVAQRLLVVLNMARGSGRGEASTFAVPKDLDGSKAKLIISNGAEGQGSSFGSEIKMEAWEGRIYLL